VLEGVHSRTVRSVSWSPDGRLLASAGFDGLTAIWESKDGEFECAATLEGHENEVKHVSWCRNSNLLATCSRDKTIWVWIADRDREFECMSVLNGHTQDVKMVRWHPTIESMLVSASYDNTIKVWNEDDDDWYCTSTLNTHTSTVWCLAFTADGRRMASCSDDTSILIWKLKTASTDGGAASSDESKAGWQLDGALAGHHSRCIYSVDWNKDGLLASGGADDAICIFGPTNANAAHSASNAVAPNTNLTPNANNNTNANASASSTSDSSTSTPSSSSLPPPPSDLNLLHLHKNAHDGDVNCVAWHPTRPDLLCSVGDDGCVKLWRWGDNASADAAATS